MRDIIPVVEDNSLRVIQAGYEFRLRLKWYRSLPISCIENLRFSLDGQVVDAGMVRLVINGREYRLEELADQVEVFWFVQDAAILRVRQPGIVKPGETHRIEVEFGLRFPYIAIGPGKFLTHINKYSAAQVAG